MIPDQGNLKNWARSSLTPELDAYKAEHKTASAPFFTPPSTRQTQGPTQYITDASNRWSPGAQFPIATPVLDTYKNTTLDTSESPVYPTAFFKALQNGPNAQNVGENFFTNRSSPNSVPPQYSSDPWSRFRNLSSLANRGYPLYSGNGQGSAADAGEGQAPGSPPLIDTYLSSVSGYPAEPAGASAICREVRHGAARRICTACVEQS